MGRGRPRLYATPEEKAAANRAKSMRSYYKKRSKLNTNRERRYRAERSKPTILPGATKDTSKMTPVEPTDVAGWMTLVDHTDTDFRLLTGDSTRRLLEFLYKRYTETNHSDTFKDTTIEVQALYKTIKRCEHALLQLCGVAKEFRAAEALGKQIHQALLCLEEVSLYASIGKAEIREAHDAGELIHQSIPY
ncbi:hypothetical protein CCMSSC00406_0004292 [Pleurotus cornucopiae]|uniref:Uncharacterized protein n=1 Tax=Pleurotus cornucopiae TaxID=5321 RepID=A0ACB7JBI4_PLECO|nr:hypothetical protein CCMSSC00406_0004292 [Pleurotus cornucopiae]